MPTFSGIDHLALTVSDLDRSVAFYQLLWGMPPVGGLSGPGHERRVFRLPSGTTIGLTRHDIRPTGSFTPFEPGLDHVGFGVADVPELQRWADHLTELGLEHSGLIDAEYGVALSVKDPDGTALEFFVRK